MNMDAQPVKFSTLAAVLPPLGGLALLIVGLLLFFEEIRLYNDLDKDGPLAMACWSFAVLITGYALWRGLGIKAINIAVLSLNLLVMVLVVILLILLSGPMRLF